MLHHQEDVRVNLKGGSIAMGGDGSVRGRGREPEGETDFFEELLNRERVLGRAPSTQEDPLAPWLADSLAAAVLIFHVDSQETATLAPHHALSSATYRVLRLVGLRGDECGGWGRVEGVEAPVASSSSQGGAAGDG
ncbi:hypothetical protein E2C01_051230 [Portunus trituberculatus]|uniref:Uncharacterized protein n=1 Tax=Portunus trituberculatus TaxID=210409 RepID=A0A5B7GE66_PORTR|nr:hypothetical protein [Portunus trituberculatus]